jgi:hypothetical protein
VRSSFATGQHVAEAIEAADEATLDTLLANFIMDTGIGQQAYHAALEWRTAFC